MDSDRWTGAAAGRWFCVTLVAGGSPAGVFGGFGGNWDEVTPLTSQDTRAMGEGLPGRIEVPVIRVGTAAGGAFAFEDASVQGARTEVPRRVSARSQAISVSLAPGDLPRLRWARGGRLAAEMVLNRPEQVRGPAAAQLTERLGADPALRNGSAGPAIASSCQPGSRWHASCAGYAPIPSRLPARCPAGWSFPCSPTRGRRLSRPRPGQQCCWPPLPETRLRGRRGRRSSG
jgi:hypothetical protein